MKSERYEMRMAGELLAAIDQQRGQLSRAAWITKVLEQALSETRGVLLTSRPARAPVASSEAVRPAASARTPGEGTPLPKIAPRRQPR